LFAQRSDSLNARDSSIAVVLGNVELFKRDGSTLVNYYNDEKNVAIQREGDQYLKIVLTDSNKIYSETEIEFVFIHDTTYFTQLLEKDSLIPDIVVRHYWQDVNHGAFVQLNNSTGKVQVKGNYYWGHKNGTWLYYDDIGNLIRKEKWNVGILDLN